MSSDHLADAGELTATLTADVSRVRDSLCEAAVQFAWYRDGRLTEDEALARLQALAEVGALPGVDGQEET